MLPHSIGDAGELVFRAPNVAQAVDFAISGQRTGLYQFFRGQENSDWLPYPSLARVADGSRDEVRARLSRFIGYTRSVSEATGLNYSTDDAWAIAQHYGLPTNFLDLTTDPVVAAMFACPRDTHWRGARATILCYSEEMIDVWSRSANKGEDNSVSVELIRIDVSNLWRLQAQRGLFLFNRAYNLHDFYMPDRIIFPHPSEGFIHPDYELYPARKSPLELQLDLFFHLESTENAKREMLDFVANTVEPGPLDRLTDGTTPRIAAAVAQSREEWLPQEQELHHLLRSNASAIPNVPLRTLPDTYFDPMWRYKHGELWPHESWFGEGASNWLKVPIEAYHPDTANVGELIVDLGAFRDVLPCGPQSVRKFIDSIKAHRRDRDAKFSVCYTSLAAASDPEANAARSKFQERLGLTASYLWTGLRRTPASDETILICIQNFLTLGRLLIDDSLKWDDCYGDRDADHLKVEYVPLGGHSRTAKALCADLETAIRSDLPDLIEVIPSDIASALAGDLARVHIRQMIYPQYLFDFDQFADIFISRILPYEAVVATVVASTVTGLAFNPRQIKVFGLA